MWSGFFFVVLNLFDAWLTKQAFALGEIELNPIVRFFGYGDNLVLKGLLALTIVLILWRFGKSHLFWHLNILMTVVILWNLSILGIYRIYF